MLIRQVSIFVENKTGSVADVVRILGEQDINIRSLQVADTNDFGILRLIVDDPNKALQIVLDAGFTAKLTDVVSAYVPDKPNGLSELLEFLKKNNVEIEYLYVFVSNPRLDAQVIIKSNNCGDLERLLLFANY